MKIKENDPAQSKLIMVRPAGTVYKVEIHQYVTRTKYLNALVRSRMLYLCAGWTITDSQMNKFDSAFIKLLRHMVKGGRQRTAPITYVRKNGTEGTYSKPVLTKEKILKITNMEMPKEFIIRQQEKWVAHCVRAEDDCYIKLLTFPDFYPGEAKKSGILNTTYRQVLQRYKKSGKTDTEMIKSFKERNLCETTGSHAQ